jgi:hypothetical protein
LGDHVSNSDKVFGTHSQRGWSNWHGESDPARSDAAPAKATGSAPGTFETCRRAPKKSAIDRAEFAAPFAQMPRRAIPARTRAGL